MPGVPSGRGCEACRRQKKKCDQAKPACSRCARLRLPCVGAGQQRYIFKTTTTTSEGSSSALSATRSNSISGGSSGTISPTRQGRSMPLRIPASQVADQPASPPSNETSLDLAKLISALQITDVRFDLTIYGDFLTDIPRRLGQNRALDEAVRAITGTVESIYPRQPSPQVLAQYSKALYALRDALNNPAEAVSANTLCAIYLVMVCQGWLIDRSDVQPRHGHAIAHLINTAAGRLTEWQGWFEEQILGSLGYVVVLFSCLNPGIVLDKRIMAYRPRGIVFGPFTSANEDTNINSLRLETFATFPEVLKSPPSHVPEIRALHADTIRDRAKLRRLIALVAGPDAYPDVLPSALERVYVRLMVAYGFVIMLSIAVNRILFIHATDPTDAEGQAALEMEASELVDDVLYVADCTNRFRPLGSGSVPLALVAAYSVVHDKERTDRLICHLADFQLDIPSTNWLKVAASVRACLQAREARVSVFDERRDWWTEEDWSSVGPDYMSCFPM